MSNLDNYLPAYGEGFGYAFDNNIISNWYPERIVMRSSLRGASLELGIGRGVTTDYFARSFGRHVVIEGSLAVIERFREKFPSSRAEVVHSYFEKFNTDERFDSIILGFVLEHVDDPVKLLAQYRELLSPGGKIFVAVPNGESLHRRFGKAAGLLDNLMALGDGDVQLGHHRQYSVAILTDHLVQAGYSVVRREGIFLKALTTNQMRSLDLEPRIIRGMCEVGVDYPELCCAILFEAEPSRR
jgi:SAM-dependent methyltransferase